MWINQRVEEWTNRLVRGETVQEVHNYLGLSEGVYQAYQRGEYTHLVGSDEVGWGALAGPLVVVAFRAPLAWTLPGLRDSKEFKGPHKYDKMEEVFIRISKAVRAGDAQYNVVQVVAERIDELGPRTALRMAHAKALELGGVGCKGTLGMVDGNLDMPFTCGCLPKADSIIPQVMAASIIAKFCRDSFMRDMAEKYPQYGFETNVGYASKEHQEALTKYGMCPLHRRTYVKGQVSAQGVMDEHGEP